MWMGWDPLSILTKMAIKSNFWYFMIKLIQFDIKIYHVTLQLPWSVSQMCSQKSISTNSNLFSSK